MGRGAGNRAKGWPRGTWPALVAVSAGTVASFTAVGWLFWHASGLGDGAVDPTAAQWGPSPEWGGGTVVVETERPDPVPAFTPKPPAEPRRRAQPQEPATESETSPRLALVEESCEPSLSPLTSEPPASDGTASPRLVLVQAHTEQVHPGE